QLEANASIARVGRAWQGNGVPVVVKLEKNARRPPRGDSCLESMTAAHGGAAGRSRPCHHPNCNFGEPIPAVLAAKGLRAPCPVLMSRQTCALLPSSGSLLTARTFRVVLIWAFLE